MNELIPSYKDALTAIVELVTDVAKEHPDEAQRERAKKALTDFVMATIMSLAKPEPKVENRVPTTNLSALEERLNAPGYTDQNYKDRG